MLYANSVVPFNVYYIVFKANKIYSVHKLCHQCIAKNANTIKHSAFTSGGKGSSICYCIKLMGKAVDI